MEDGIEQMKRDFETVRGSMMSERNIVALRRMHHRAVEYKEMYENEHRLHQIAAARVALLEEELHDTATRQDA